MTKLYMIFSYYLGKVIFIRYWVHSTMKIGGIRDPFGSIRCFRSPWKFFARSKIIFLLLEFGNIKIWSFRKINYYVSEISGRGPKNSLCGIWSNFPECQNLEIRLRVKLPNFLWKIIFSKNCEIRLNFDFHPLSWILSSIVISQDDPEFRFFI